MRASSLADANWLLLAIPLDGARVLLTISPPIVRVAGPPFLGAVEAYLAVFRVCSDLPAVIFSAAAALAVGVAADRLRRLILRGLKDSLTIAALPFDHKRQLSHPEAHKCLGGEI